MNYKIKKITNTLALSLAFFCSQATVVQSNDDWDLDALCQNLDSIDRSQMKGCEPGEAAEWVSYLDLLQIPKIFNEDLYKSTALPAYRNVINFPNFFIFSYQEPQEQQLTFHWFYNQTNKRDYVKSEKIKSKTCGSTCYTKGNRLGSYLNIENGTFLSVLDEDLNSFGSLLPSELDPVKNLDFPRLFTTLANAHLQERRLGFMAHYHREMSPTVFLEAKLPVLWCIRNLNYTNKEKAELEKEFSAFQSSGGSGNAKFDEVQFGKDHLVMDAFGTGTLDLTLKKLIYESDTTKWLLGASLYLPTDHHFTKGLYGTYFEPKDQQPLLRLCDIVNLDQGALEPNAKETIETYFLSALDHLSSAILQCPLGYNKHFAFAGKVLPYWQIRENLEYSGVWIFEYLVPTEHPRFFIKKDDGKLFSDEFEALDGEPEKQLDLLERKMTERLFPRVFNTKVSPGFLFNTVANLQWTHKDWNFTAGYNWWYRSSEKLSNIKAPADLLPELDICKATTLSSTQVKLYGKINKNFITKRHQHNVSFSLYGNTTLYNDNHGHDFTIGFSFDKVF